eukprot:4999487-Alexandrium_andersonii.AAC.1
MLAKESAAGLARASTTSRTSGSGAPAEDIFEARTAPNLLALVKTALIMWPAMSAPLGESAKLRVLRETIE